MYGPGRIDLTLFVSDVSYIGNELDDWLEYRSSRLGSSD